MKFERIIAPSILSLDYSKMTSQVEELNASKAKWLHFDVMDGHFVPNLTFGPDILKGFKKATPLFLDVHLMITDPFTYAPVFIKAGADLITFHTESLDNDIEKIKELIELIHSLGAKAGITVRPATPIEQFSSVLSMCDLVLIMSVNPGFGGQSFMPDQLDKVRYLYAQREEHDYSYRIEIDGGINYETAKLACQAGVDTLVAGSFIFKNDIKETVEGLLNA